MLYNKKKNKRIAHEKKKKEEKKDFFTFNSFIHDRHNYPWNNQYHNI